ncbi:MAG: hypothetical protein AAGJ90_14645, partial [Pseudomonadota bacterium]
KFYQVAFPHWYVRDEGKEGCKHLTQHSASNHQPHLTSPSIKLQEAQIKNSKKSLYLNLT